MKDYPELYDKENEGMETPSSESNSDVNDKDNKSDIGQPWCGESVRIVKLSHLGLVEVPHNPVHVILREEFPHPQKYQ